MLSAVESSYTPLENPATREMPGPARDLFKLRKKLVKVSKRACPLWLSSQVEDITQDVLIKLTDKGKQTNETHKTLSCTYLNRAAFHAVVDEVRKSKRHKNVLSIDLDSTEEECFDLLPTPTRTPEQDYITGEVMDEVRRCFKQLTLPKRTAVNLYLLGHTLEEISHQQGWSEAQATNLVYRGLANLRCSLKEKGLQPSKVA